MKTCLLITVFILIPASLFAQEKNTWVSFWNKDTTLIGFKDKHGVVKIEPKFTGFTNAGKFEHIIAATEDVNGRWESYYLTKTGKIIGKDSLYTFDNTSDCENERLIRFRDPVTHKVGMFNGAGEMAIPAEYNDLSRARNGLIIARKDAVWYPDKSSEILQFPWLGGKTILIDTGNKILLDSFTINLNLNLFSLQISEQPSEDTLRQNFRSTDGKYYSFIDFDKEFESWLQFSLLNHLTKADLLTICDSKIVCWKDSEGWVSVPKQQFINKNFEMIKAKLAALKFRGSKYNIFNEPLNPYIYESPEYEQYYNNCGEPQDGAYPVKNIVISYSVKRKLTQDFFEFLRTKYGYKLISVTIRKGRIR
jgi:hypothetical protein